MGIHSLPWGLASACLYLLISNEPSVWKLGFWVKNGGGLFSKCHITSSFDAVISSLSISCDTKISCNRLFQDDSRIL